MVPGNLLLNTSAAQGEERGCFGSGNSTQRIALAGLFLGNVTWFRLSIANTSGMRRT